MWALRAHSKITNILIVSNGLLVVSDDPWVGKDTDNIICASSAFYVSAFKDQHQAPATLKLYIDLLGRCIFCHITAIPKNSVSEEVLVKDAESVVAEAGAEAAVWL